MILLAWTLATLAGSTLEIFTRPNGALQCQPETRRTETQVRGELKRAKIRFESLRQVSDGQFRTQVCGSPTGLLDVVRASASQEKSLRQLGFRKQSMPLQPGS